MPWSVHGQPVAAANRPGSGLGPDPRCSRGRTGVFKWMVFFILVLAGILAFVSWVMGIPIPGFSGFQQNPFNQ